jgi:hypothetical protein
MEQAAIVLADDEDGVRAFAFDATKPAVAPSIEARRGARLTLLLYDASLGALNLDPGLIPPASGEERPLPTAAAYYGAEARGEVEWSALMGLPDVYASFRIPALSPKACADAGGCYTDALAVEARTCAIPCPASFDVGEVVPPALPSPPRHLPCPPRWIEVDGACSPPSRVTCAGGQVQWIDEVGCAPMDACPAGRFAENLPAGTLYVDPASPGGSGTEADPFRALADAIAAAIRGDTIALARGVHTGSVAVAGVAIAGACASETEVRGVGSAPALIAGDLDLRGVTLAAASGSALVSSGALTFERLRVLGAATPAPAAVRLMGGSFGGTSLVIDAPQASAIDGNGAVNVERAVIESRYGISSFSSVPMRLVDAVVTGTEGSGVQAPGSLEVRRSLFEDHGQYGIQAYGVGDARIEDVVVRRCGSASFRGGGGIALSSDTSTVVRVLVEDVRNQGINLSQTRGVVRDTTVRRLVPLVPHQDEAEGISVLFGRSRLTRVRISESHGRGISWNGGAEDAIDLEDVEVSVVGDADLAGPVTQGFGFTGFSGRVIASRIRITDVHTTGFFVASDAQVVLSDVTIERSLNGNGIGLANLNQFGVERAALVDNETTGLEIDGSIGTVDDVSVTGGRIGLTFGGGGNIVGGRVAVRDAMGLGMCVRDQIELTLDHVSVDGVRRVASAPCTLTNPPPGTGIFLNGQPAFMLQSFRIADSEDVGILVNRDAKTTLLDGEISGSFIGAQIDPAVDPATLMVRVSFRDNQTNIEQ